MLVVLYSVFCDCGYVKRDKNVLNYNCNWKVSYMIAVVSAGANHQKLSMSN